MTSAERFRFRMGNVPSLPPTAPPETPMKLRLHLAPVRYPYRYWPSYQWQLPLPLGAQAALQFSTNLTDWVSFAVVTNQGMAVEWFESCGSAPSRFFRVVPQ